MSDHSQGTPLEHVKRCVLAASIGSCDCNTKSPEVFWHLPHCRYVKLMQALDWIDTALSSPQSDDDLEDLIARFSKALLAKLKLARANGRSGWDRDDWQQQCQAGLLKHLEKGDPRDVAAYCAFMWHHGWATASHSPVESVEDWRDDPAQDERWSAGVDFAMVQVCRALDVDPEEVRWDAATETLEGDIQAVIWNILRVRFGEDWEPPSRSPAGSVGK